MESQNIDSLSGWDLKAYERSVAVMKKLSVLFLVGLMGFSAAANAALMGYTFTGQVTSINDGAGAASIAGVTNGDTITYRFSVDRDLPGTLTQNNGSTQLFTDTGTTDYFFDDLLSGSVIDEVNGGYFNAPTDTAEYNRGFRNTNSGYTQLRVGSADNFIQITSSLDIDLWSVGLYVSGMEVASNAIGNQTLVISNLRLSNIVPVPIPAAAWLFATGFLGLLGFKYQKRKS